MLQNPIKKFGKSMSFFTSKHDSLIKNLMKKTYRETIY